MPPARRSSTASSISCPAPRSARPPGATNVPRSGSSGPGYICETTRMRIGSSRQREERVRSYSPHSSRRTPQISPIGAARAQAPAHRREQVRIAPGGAADGVERVCRRRGVPLRAHARGALDLASLGGRIEPVQLDRLPRLAAEDVHTDDRALARLDLLLPAERRRLDLALDEALLDGRDGAADLVDPLDQLPRARLELVGQRLDVVRAAERVDGRGRAAFRLQDLLRAQRDRRGALRRQRKRLVERVRVQRLGAAADRRQAPARRRGRCCSRAAAPSASSRRSAHENEAQAPSGWSRRSARA